jgi:hypothetical protein
MRKLLTALSFWLIAGSHGFFTTTTGGSTSAVEPTRAEPYSTATTNVLLLDQMPNTRYSAACSVIDAYGFPSVMSIEKFTHRLRVTISNGSGKAAVVSGGAAIDCIVAGGQ